MFTYLLQIIIFQVLFLAVYDFFLSKETFHKYNRWYLITTPILSFVLPLIKIPTFQKAMPQEIMVFLPEVMLSPQKVIEQTTFYTDGSINYVSLFFWIGVVFFTLIFLVKLFKIIQLIAQNEIIKTHFYQLVLLPKRNNAFSFFNYIFLGTDIPSNKKDEIIEHELIHATQKHSLDLLFFELLKIIMWFNPMIYFYQRRITLLHEYISDAAIVKTTQKQAYFNTLLNQAFQVENISFVNQFYKHSFIKKRIIMMTKNKSNPFRKAKYLLLLPLLASMLMYTSCETNQIEEVEVISQKELQTSYREFEGEVTTHIGKKETYLDSYFGDKFPKGTEIKYKNLTKKERKEFDEFYSNYEEIKNKKNSISDFLEIKLFRDKNKRGVLAMIVKIPNAKNKNDNTDEIIEIEEITEDVPFKNTNDISLAIIENVPVFPGCTGTREEQKKCLTTSIRKLIAANFNSDLTKNAGLTKGVKKIFVQFRINEQGSIEDVNVMRSPNTTLKEEAERVVNLLPKMIPGKQRGKSVGMKYTLPISFVVE